MSFPRMKRESGTIGSTLLYCIAKYVTTKKVTFCVTGNVRKCHISGI